jgi:hypothetical protein
MKNSVLVLSFFLAFGFNGFSQEDQINLEAVNNYKYIIVPLKYEFLSDADQYQINSLTKFLFNKYGYTAFLENDPFPDDLRNNSCLALTSEVIKAKGGFLSTRLQINLKDCNGKLIVSSKVGKTREKEFKVAYNLALRNAFETFQFYEYAYTAGEEMMTLSSETTNDDLKENNDGDMQLAQEGNKGQNAKVLPVLATSTIENTKEQTQTLYAQPTDKGFQVVDSSPKVVMILLETSKPNTFIVKDQNAIVYKEDGFWYLSKNDGIMSSLEILNIKF